MPKKKLMGVCGMNVDLLEEIEDRVCWNMSFGIEPAETIEEFDLSRAEKDYLITMYKDERKVPKVSEKNEG